MWPLRGEHVICSCVLHFLDGLGQWEKIWDTSVLILAQHQSGVPVGSVPLIWTFGAYVKMLLQCFSSVSESTLSIGREVSAMLQRYT